MSAHRISPSGKAGAHTSGPCNSKKQPTADGEGSRELKELQAASGLHFGEWQERIPHTFPLASLSPKCLRLLPAVLCSLHCPAPRSLAGLRTEGPSGQRERRAQTSLHVPSRAPLSLASPFVQRREALSPAGKVRKERLPGGGQQGKLLGVRTGEGLSRQREEPRPEQLLILCPPHTEPSPCSRCLAHAIPSPAHGHAVGSARARI